MAQRTGEQLEQAVLTALQEKLERLGPLSERLAVAAERLKNDYQQDEGLTAFTALDADAFYDKG